MRIRLLNVSAIQILFHAGSIEKSHSELNLAVAAGPSWKPAVVPTSVLVAPLGEIARKRTLSTVTSAPSEGRTRMFPCSALKRALVPTPFVAPPAPFSPAMVETTHGGVGEGAAGAREGVGVKEGVLETDGAGVREGLAPGLSEGEGVGEGEAVSGQSMRRRRVSRPAT